MFKSNAYEAVRKAIAQRSATDKRETVVADAAVRWWLRERSLALQLWNHGTLGGTQQIRPDECWQTADKFIRRHYPTYDPSSMHPVTLSRTWMPPLAASQPCGKVREAAMQGPGQRQRLGVAAVRRRSQDRVRRDPMDLNKWWICPSAAAPRRRSVSPRAEAGPWPAPAAWRRCRAPALAKPSSS